MDKGSSLCLFTLAASTIAFRGGGGGGGGGDGGGVSLVVLCRKAKGPWYS